jgi:hypothetical protein
MGLTNAYVLPSGRIPDLFQKIRDGQPPERFTSQQLKDWGFTSTNDRAFIGLLKALGFLTTDGRPTQRYSDYRDHTRSKGVLGEGMKEAYGDIFLIKENPTESDRGAIQGKCTISRNGPARFRVNGPTLHGLPAEPRFGSFTRPSMTSLSALWRTSRNWGPG